MNALQTARTQLLAGLAMIDTLAETYPTEFNEQTAVVTEEAKPTPKKRAPRTTKKPAEKPEVEPEVEKEPEPEPTPVKEKKTVTAPSESKLTLADLTALAKKAVAGSDRDTVKATISTYGAKLSAVPSTDYETLADELKELV